MSFLRTFSRFTARLWFHRLKVEGPQPPAGPVLIVLNHPNGLLDALVPAALLHCPPRFVAKAALWKLLPLRPFLALFDPIPVQRVQDLPEGASEAARKSAVAATFQAVHQAFEQGDAVGIFPEGISHGGHDLAPLKTGAARMVLGAKTRPVLVPAGLVYGDRQIFRHGVLLRLGPSIPTEDLAGDDPESVQILTARVRQALYPLTLHGPEAEQLALAQDLAWLLAEGPRPGVDLEGFRERVRTFEAWLGGLPEGERLRLKGEVDRVQAWLRERGLRPDQVGHPYPFSGTVAWLPQALLRLALFAACLPFALPFWPPYRLVGWLAGRLTQEVDVTATLKLFAGLIFLPLWALGLGWLAWRTFAMGSPLWLPLGALAAWMTLPLSEALAQDLQAVRGWKARKDPAVPDLVEARERLVRAVPGLERT